MADDDRSPQMDADGELVRALLSLVSTRDDTIRVQADTIKDQNSVIRELLQNQRDARKRKIRDVARHVVQEEFLELAAAKPPRPKKKAREPGHVTYPVKDSFDKKIHETLTTLCDPKNFDKLTVKGVLTLMHLSSANTLWGLLKDYGHTLKNETLSVCLHRLADEWHPEWRGVNRQRF